MGVANKAAHVLCTPIEYVFPDGNDHDTVAGLDARGIEDGAEAGGDAAPEDSREPGRDLRRDSDQFGDVKLAAGGTVGDKAQLELDDLLHLADGKVAPEIEGQDQDGKDFKLYFDLESGLPRVT